MKEKLIEDLEKEVLRKIAERLGVGNLNKKNKEILKKHILVFSYSQITSALSFINNK